MEKTTANIILTEDLHYPITFHTAKTRHDQETVLDRTMRWHQILLVLDGEGTFQCNGQTYKIKRGCAFFTSAGTRFGYINEGELKTAFLTASGPAADALAHELAKEGFLFIEEANVELYIDRIAKIIEEYMNSCDQSKLSVLTYSVFVEFLSQRKSRIPDWLDKTARYINLHISEKLTLENLARLNYISTSKLCHGFKKYYSKSVFEYIIDVRLQHAREMLLTSPEMMAKEVASACGFSDNGYFCKAYRKKFGRTPTDEKAKAN